MKLPRLPLIQDDEEAERAGQALWRAGTEVSCLECVWGVQKRVHFWCMEGKPQKVDATVRHAAPCSFYREAACSSDSR